MDDVSKVINYWYENKLGSKYEVGVICAVHTFGTDLKWNPHIHALITEGGIDEENKWFKSVSCIPYEFLRKSWQKVVLDIFKDYETRKLISVLYRKYKNGFYRYGCSAYSKKGFRIVRRYGLYARRKNKLSNVIFLNMPN